ncbi:MAG: flotillin family protein, partial [Leptolyngbya sp.]|nr:flotillin family protein [Candidatus Melainabacteria bacterium]
MGMEIGIAGMVGVGVVFFAFLVWMVSSFYQKCGPNQAMIISGMFSGEEDRKFKIVVGGGTTVFPVIQQRSFLSLEVMTIEIKSTAPIITKNGVPVFVEGVAQVKV